MIDLSTTDFFVIIGYFGVIVVLSALFRTKRFKEMFGEEIKPNWLLLAASLLMIEWSPMSDMMGMGIILEQGYSGIWFLKSSFWLAGVPAILYATMWSRLKFQTDNELIRLRFSGRSGVSLHVFRALYLAFFVIPFFGAFHILSLRKLLDLLSLGTFLNPEIILVIGVLSLVLKNSFHQKIRTDSFHAIVCILAPILICFFLFKAHGGGKNIYDTLEMMARTKTQLIPQISSAQSNSSFADFFVFFFIQWWSVNIVDSSDPKAQRHLQAKNEFAAFRTLFVPILIASLMFLFVSTIWDCGLFEYTTKGYANIDNEAFFLQVAMQYLPGGIRAIVLIAIVFSSITILESLINWGGGLLTVDIIKTYLYKKGKDRHYTYVSFGAMLVVSVISLLFAFNSSKIQDLQKFVFSISAGVAPVFMLRWFWWRINAWTQIAAMLSSLVYTLVYDFLYQNNSGFKLLIDMLCSSTGLSSYPIKIVILTTLVVCTWITVMYCTKADEMVHLRGFVEKTGTGGLWPKDFKRSDYRLSKRVLLCFIFAITYVLPIFFIREFKFGSLSIAIALLLLFIGLAAYVYRSVSVLLNSRE